MTERPVITRFSEVEQGDILYLKNKTIYLVFTVLGMVTDHLRDVWGDPVAGDYHRIEFRTVNSTTLLQNPRSRNDAMYATRTDAIDPVRGFAHPNSSSRDIVAYTPHHLWQKSNSPIIPLCKNADCLKATARSEWGEYLNFDTQNAVVDTDPTALANYGAMLRQEEYVRGNYTTAVMPYTFTTARGRF
jgi:hypothetical protein